MIALSEAKAVVFGGKSGLLGKALVNELQCVGAEVVALSSRDVDIRDLSSVRALVERERPSVVFNAAAYTAVDLAEDEWEHTFAINADGAANVAQSSGEYGAKLVHFSTDFVFDGTSSIPYLPDDVPNPISIYGKSKAEGERRIVAMGLESNLIVRISWLFGPGKINFVEKILQLARGRELLTVVNDQTGSPSYTPDLAKNTLELLSKDAFGVYHLANSGPSSWYDLARHAIETAGIQCDVVPVGSESFPTKATRPSFSVLDLKKFTQTTEAVPRPWFKAVEAYIQSVL